jgi:transcriptional regulator with XRE-family HTH domain
MNLKQRAALAESIAYYLKRSRAAADKTQHEVARSMRMARSHVANLESGRNFPALDTFVKFCSAVDASPGVVLSAATARAGAWKSPVRKKGRR